MIFSAQPGWTVEQPNGEKPQHVIAWRTEGEQLIPMTLEPIGANGYAIKSPDCKLVYYRAKV
jgi:hypothetical protein